MTTEIKKKIEPNTLCVDIVGRPIDKVTKQYYLQCFSCLFRATIGAWKIKDHIPIQIQVCTCPKCGSRQVFERHPKDL